MSPIALYCPALMIRPVLQHPSWRKASTAASLLTLQLKNVAVQIAAVLLSAHDTTAGMFIWNLSRVLLFKVDLMCSQICGF